MSLKNYYSLAKNYVVKAGYDWEIVWQESIGFDNINGSDFLREAAWVVLSSGMHERVVRKHFSAISSCFYEWKAINKIIENKRFCVEYALHYFNNPKKINAIANIVQIIHDQGYTNFKLRLKTNPIELLQTLPYIGPITSYHLAKNIGLSFAKADRHVTRISKAFGFDCVQQFCTRIAEMTGDAVEVVDVVLWRFANLRSDYLDKTKIA